MFFVLVFMILREMCSHCGECFRFGFAMLVRVLPSCLVCFLVLCVFVVVFCVWGRLLATIPVESQHQPRQNGQLLCTHIIKLALKHPKHDWMRKLVIIQRCCTRFDFLGAKLCGLCYECAKKPAKIR
jgi:hypothetical protein